MDRADVHDDDELWIAKYRAALKDIPVQQSSLMKVRAALAHARKILFSRLEGILDLWAKSNSQRSSRSIEVHSVLQPHSLIGNKSRAAPARKPPVKKAAPTTAGLMQPRLTNKRRTRRGA